MRRRVRNVATVSAIVVVALLVAGCAAPPSGDTRYVDQVFASTTSHLDLPYATAPALITGSTVTLSGDVYEPAGDTLVSRPAIVWVHGGGFAAGSRSSVAGVAAAYARRGYVTLNVSYRLDPGNRCQDVQHDRISDPTELAAERARCMAAIRAAQHDTQAAVRWLRANAATYGVDVSRIAVGGFSAGAITAVNLAQRADDPGVVGDHLDQPSTVAAASSASGCNYETEWIDGADAPISLLASEHDDAVLFSCTLATEQVAEAVGTPVQTLYHLGEGTHALDLYAKYRVATDAAWTSFLVEHLSL